MNTDAKNQSLTPEQAKAPEESLESINAALAVEEKDREPGKPYIKHTHRVTHETITLCDPKTGKERKLTDEERATLFEYSGRLRLSEERPVYQWKPHLYGVSGEPGSV